MHCHQVLELPPPPPPSAPPFCKCSLSVAMGNKKLDVGAASRRAPRHPQTQGPRLQARRCQAQLRRLGLSLIGRVRSRSIQCLCKKVGSAGHSVIGTAAQSTSPSSSAAAARLEQGWRGTPGILCLLPRVAVSGTFSPLLQYLSLVSVSGQYSWRMLERNVLKAILLKRRFIKLKICVLKGFQRIL